MKRLLKSKDLFLFRNTKKGSLTVETAIFLPLFIIGVLSIAYILKIMLIEEAVFNSFTDEARLLSAEASFYDGRYLFESKLKSRIFNENDDNIYDLDLENFRYRYSRNGMTDLISMDLNYNAKIKLPLPFYNEVPISESIVFRGFVGSSQTHNPMTYEEMQTDKKSEIVWIFPRAGKKYHDQSCSYIVNEPKEIRITESIRRRYSPCSICKPSKLSNGNLVYCFTKTGEAYHQGNCPTVEKYVISIEKENAIKKGYSPCAKCGG